MRYNLALLLKQHELKLVKSPFAMNSSKSVTTSVSQKLFNHNHEAQNIKKYWNFNRCNCTKSFFCCQNIFYCFRSSQIFFFRHKNLNINQSAMPTKKNKKLCSRDNCFLFNKVFALISFRELAKGIWNEQVCSNVIIVTFSSDSVFCFRKLLAAINDLGAHYKSGTVE